jgi:hypothetical protein
MLTYKKEDGTESTRKVTPYTTKKDVFNGKDHSREGQLRSFKLERILKMEKTSSEGQQKTAFELGFEKQAISFFGKNKPPAVAPMTTSVVPHPGNYAGGGTSALAQSSGPNDAIKAQRNARRAAEAAGSKAVPAVEAKAAPSAIQKGSSILKGFAKKMPVGKVLGGAALVGGGLLAGKALLGSSQPQQGY